MEFNNPFKDLDKKKFKDTSAQNSIQKKKSSATAKTKSKDISNSNVYNSYKESSQKDFTSTYSNNSNILDSKTELSDTDLFLQSMQSTLKTDFIDTDKDKYYIKNQDDSINLKKKSSNKNTSKSIHNSFKEKNINNDNTENKLKQNPNNSFTTISSILDKKLSLKEENLLLNKDISKKAVFNKKELEAQNTEDFLNTNTTDEDDFLLAMAGVKQIDKEKIHTPEVEKIIVQNDPKPLMFDYEEGKLEFSFSSNNEHVQCNILGLDLHILAQLQNRHYNPESYIDLHGFNARQAFDALIPFFKNAYYKDMRSLLIVTGKGLNSFDGKPFLRSKVCDWLIQNPFKHIVIAFCTAKPEDGGSGALYVLLRKRKKNAKEINWDKIPNDYDLWAHLDR